MTRNQAPDDGMYQTFGQEAQGSVEDYMGYGFHRRQDQNKEVYNQGMAPFGQAQETQPPSPAYSDYNYSMPPFGYEQTGYLSQQDSNHSSYVNQGFGKPRPPPGKVDYSDQGMLPVFAEEPWQPFLNWKRAPVREKKQEEPVDDRIRPTRRIAEEHPHFVRKNIAFRSINYEGSKFAKNDLSSPPKMNESRSGYISPRAKEISDFSRNATPQSHSKIGSRPTTPKSRGKISNFSKNLTHQSHSKIGSPSRPTTPKSHGKKKPSPRKKLKAHSGHKSSKPPNLTSVKVQESPWDKKPGHSGHKSSPSGHSDHKSSPSGHSGHKSSPYGRSGHKSSPSGRSGHKSSPSGRSGHKSSPSGHSGHKSSPSGHSSHKSSPSGHSGHKSTHSGHSSHKSSKPPNLTTVKVPKAPWEHGSTPTGSKGKSGISSSSLYDRSGKSTPKKRSTSKSPSKHSSKQVGSKSHDYKKGTSTPKKHKSGHTKSKGKKRPTSPLYDGASLPKKSKREHIKVDISDSDSTEFVPASYDVYPPETPTYQTSELENYYSSNLTNTSSSETPIGLPSDNAQFEYQPTDTFPVFDDFSRIKTSEDSVIIYQEPEPFETHSMENLKVKSLAAEEFQPNHFDKSETEMGDTLHDHLAHYKSRSCLDMARQFEERNFHEQRGRYAVVKLKEVNENAEPAFQRASTGTSKKYIPSLFKGDFGITRLDPFLKTQVTHVRHKPSSTFRTVEPCNKKNPPYSTNVTKRDLELPRSKLPDEEQEIQIAIDLQEESSFIAINKRIRAILPCNDRIIKIPKSDHHPEVLMEHRNFCQKPKAEATQLCDDAVVANVGRHRFWGKEHRDSSACKLRTTLPSPERISKNEQLLQFLRGSPENKGVEVQTSSPAFKAELFEFTGNVPYDQAPDKKSLKSEKYDSEFKTQRAVFGTYDSKPESATSGKTLFEQYDSKPESAISGKVLFEQYDSKPESSTSQRAIYEEYDSKPESSTSQRAIYEQYDSKPESSTSQRAIYEQYDSYPESSTTPQRAIFEQPKLEESSTSQRAIIASMEEIRNAPRPHELVHEFRRSFSK